MANYNARVSSIRHIYKPGTYKAILGLGKLSGQADYTNNFDKLKADVRDAAIADAIAYAQKETNITPPLQDQLVKFLSTPSTTVKKTIYPTPWVDLGLNNTPASMEILKKIKEKSDGETK